MSLAMAAPLGHSGGAIPGTLVDRENGALRISRTEVFVLADPPSRAGDSRFEMPSPGGWGVRIRELAFLRVHTDEGPSGLAELFSVPAGVAKAVLDGPDSYLGRHLVGQDPIPPERVWRALHDTVLHSNRRGWQMICIGAVDIALWDLFGKVLGRPVYQLLGGSAHAPHQTVTGSELGAIVPYATIISSEWDRETVLAEQIEHVEALRDSGYRAVKIEPLRSTSATILELTRRAREALGPDRTLCVDVGCLWNDVGAAKEVAARLVPHDVFFLETPFPPESLEAYARLTAASPVRIAAGEHSVSRWEFLDLMDRGGVHVVQPYMSTVGGLTEACRLLDLASPRGVLVVPGNWSTQVLGAATVQFALASPLTPLIEYAPAAIYPSPLRKAIEDLGPPVADGLIRAPEAPGNGVELPEDLVRHFRVD